MSKLRRVRQLFNEDQVQFGKRVGFTQAWVSKMENGLKPIPKTLEVLLEYMERDELEKLRLRFDKGLESVNSARVRLGYKPIKESDLLC